MTSIIFPGQGSQFLGMTKDFFDNFSIAKDTITEIEDVTSMQIKKIIFGDNDNLLNITNFTQISIFAASMSIYQTLEKNFGFKNLNINNMLGHSLGEYSALAASKSLTIAQASSLLKIRGELMNSAIEPNTTKMAALIGMGENNIIQFCRDLLSFKFVSHSPTRCFGRKAQFSLLVKVIYFNHNTINFIR